MIQVANFGEFSETGSTNQLNFGCYEQAANKHTDMNFNVEKFIEESRGMTDLTPEILTVLPVPRSNVKQMTEKVGEYAELAISVIKIAAPVSVIVGALMLVLYLNRVGAPSPVANLSSGFAFSILAGAAGFIILVLANLAIAPIFFSQLDCGRSIREVLLNPKNSWRQRSFLYRSRAYLIYFGPLVAICAVFSVAIFNPPLAWIKAASYIACGACLMSFWLGQRRQWLILDYGKFLQWADWLRLNGFTMFWLVTLYQIGFKLWAKLMGPNWQNWPEAIGLAILPVLMHFFVATSPKKLPISAWYIICLSIVILNLDYVGALSLRFLRIGGGLPVSLLMRGNQQYKTGCLILDLGNDVAIIPAKTDKECLDRWFPANAQRTYNVERYGRTDIATFSYFIKEEGTQDVSTIKNSKSSSGQAPAPPPAVTSTK